MENNKNICVVTGSLIIPEKVFTDGGAEKLLEPLREQLKQFVPDPTTAKGRKEIASFAAKFGKSKTLVDGLGKKLKAEYKVKIDPIDRERKIFRDECDKLRDEARKPLTDWETEQERIKAEKEFAREQAEWDAAVIVDFNKCFDDAILENDIFNRERDIRIKEEEMKRKEDERKAKEEAERIEKERNDREEQIKKDAAEKAKREAEEKALKEKVEAERIIQEAKDREYQLKREADAAEQKRLADIEAEKVRAENERIIAEKRAEREKQDALDRQRREHEERERVKRYRIAEENRIAELKAANMNHRKAVNNKVLKKLTSQGCSDVVAKNIIKELLTNPIPEITINY